MRTVSVFRFRDNLSNYLNAVVEREASLIVSRFGKPVAIVSPYKAEHAVKAADYFGFLGKGEGGKEFLRRVRRSKKEKSYIEALLEKR